jgi:hypothetical protein
MSVSYHDHLIFLVVPTDSAIVSGKLRAEAPDLRARPVPKFFGTKRGSKAIDKSSCLIPLQREGLMRNRYPLRRAVRSLSTLTQASSRRVKQTAMAGLLGMISIAACQSDAPTSPRMKSIPVAPASTIYDPGSQTLGVAINGPSKSTAPGTLTWRRIVSGGSGNYRFDWFQAYCYNDIEFCSELSLMQSGPDTSFSVYYPENIGKMRIVLHVFDDQLEAFAGSSNRDVPNMVIQTPYTNPNYTCDYGQGYYPVADIEPQFYPDSTKYYRRNGCTGAREYAPPQ